MARCVSSATTTSTATGEAADDNTEEGGDSINDSLEYTGDAVNYSHDASSDCLKDRLDLLLTLATTCWE